MIKKVIDTVQNFFKNTLYKEGTVIGVKKEDDRWKVQIEVAEDVEYMRKRARDDIMVVYEVSVTLNYEVHDFERISMRPRDTSFNT